MQLVDHLLVRRFTSENRGEKCSLPRSNTKPSRATKIVRDASSVRRHSWTVPQSW